MMTLPRIGSYGKFSSGNYGMNCTWVEFGLITLYYSYKTIVGFSEYPSTKTISCENIWGNTTGKHLNWIEPDKQQRLPCTEFKRELEKVLVKYDYTR